VGGEPTGTLGAARANFSASPRRRDPNVSALADTIDLYYWEGCPSYPEALALLRSVIADRGLGVDVTVHEVRTDDEAVALRFPGSPTIRVDGRDVDPVGAAGRPALNCRIYRLPDGRVSPVPSRTQLEEALR
jgi:hypothetical protein